MAELRKDIGKLLEAGVIDESVAQRINDYYQKAPDNRIQRLFLIFGIFGAVLIGLGAILIIAHNWDHFNRITKTLFAFLPLLVGQGVSLYALISKKESLAWREAGSILLFFGVGASISLISQIYHIPGDLTGYLFTWMILVLPLMYLMGSSMTSLMYIIGITVYAVESNYGIFNQLTSAGYWFFLFAGLPYYYQLIRNKPTSNFTAFHHWFIALSLTISLGSIARENVEWMYLSYVLLFGIIQKAGHLLTERSGIGEYNGMRIVGSLGTVVMLILLSFSDIWSDIRNASLTDAFITSEFLSVVVLVILMIALILTTRKFQEEGKMSIPVWIYIAALLSFFIGFSWPGVVVIINLMVLAIGILKIREGVEKDNLIILNFGMLIIAVLIACRFLDTDLSFVIRGILFIAVGTGFFMTNYFLLKRRKHA